MRFVCIYTTRGLLEIPSHYWSPEKSSKYWRMSTNFLPDISKTKAHARDLFVTARMAYKLEWQKVGVFTDSTRQSSISDFVPAPCCSMVGQFECVFLRRLYLTIMCSITSSTNRKCITYRNADTRGLTTTSSNIHTKFGVVGTGGARDILADRQTRTCTQTRAA